MDMIITVCDNAAGEALGRVASDTFAGIRPDDVAGFIGAQILGAITAVLLYGWIYGVPAPASARVNE